MDERKPQSYDDVIDELRHRDPFAPFYIVMSSGDRYLIDDPFMMVVTANEIIYVVPRSERIARLRKSQIAAIEELERRPAA
ncbi:MAG: hypothetical protein ACTHN5_19225 [Phycisphaerae bacterium]